MHPHTPTHILSHRGVSRGSVAAVWAMSRLAWGSYHMLTCLIVCVPRLPWQVCVHTVPVEKGSRGQRAPLHLLTQPGGQKDPAGHHANSRQACRPSELPHVPCVKKKKFEETHFITNALQLAKKARAWHSMPFCWVLNQQMCVPVIHTHAGVDLFNITKYISKIYKHSDANISQAIHMFLKCSSSSSLWGTLKGFK